MQEVAAGERGQARWAASKMDNSPFTPTSREHLPAAKMSCSFFGVHGEKRSFKSRAKGGG